MQKTAYEQTIRKNEAEYDFKYNYAEKLSNIIKKTEESDCCAGLLAPAGYILKFGNTKIIADPSLWKFEISDESKNILLNYIRQCKNVVFTHGHADHFDINLIKELASDDITWFVPDFLENSIQDCGISNGKIVFTKKDEEYTLGNVKLKIFESRHSHSSETVPEYGFAVEYNGKNYVFVGDVRDYGTHEIYKPNNVEVLFAHLWLGKANALNLHANKYTEKFCNFVNFFDSERVFIAHLFDCRRTIEDMWTDLHFDLVKGKLKNPVLFKMGDWYEI